MLKELIKIANKLDCIGLVKEADCLDAIIKKADEVDYSPETRQSLESAMNIDDMQSTDNRIKELESLVKEKFDRGDFIENRLNELKTQEDPTAESIREVAEYSKEFATLDLEATGLLAELVNLSFSQGKMLSALKEMSGLVGVNAEEESLIREVEEMAKNLEEGVPQYNWGMPNLSGMPEEKPVINASILSNMPAKRGAVANKTLKESIMCNDNKIINNLIKLANYLDNRGLAKEADYLDSLIKKADTSLQGLPADHLSPDLLARQKLEEWRELGPVDWCELDALGPIWATKTTEFGVIYVDRPIQGQRRLLELNGLGRAMHPGIGITPERDCPPKPKENAG